MSNIKSLVTFTFAKASWLKTTDSVEEKLLSQKICFFSHFMCFLIFTNFTLDIYVHREAEMLDIFRKFDRNKDGYVTREELQTTLEECKMRLLEIDMDDVMKKADRDGDGKLSFDDFIKSCRFKNQ